jgi:hypothetical protein
LCVDKLSQVLLSRRPLLIGKGGWHQIIFLEKKKRMCGSFGIVVGVVNATDSKKRKKGRWLFCAGHALSHDPQDTKNRERLLHKKTGGEGHTLLHTFHNTARVRGLEIHKGKRSSVECRSCVSLL